MDFLYLLHQTACGGLAAAGFGVLFNVRFRALSLCAASGGLALAVRTLVLGWNWSMEAATFVAAVVLGLAVLLLPQRAAVPRNALLVVGGIPMIPGGFATKAILGLFAITATHVPGSGDALLPALDNTLRVIFVLGALGAGLAVPLLLRRVQAAK